jgi:uncharacterized protein YcfL
MKKIICLCVGLLMLIGCSSRLITASNEKLDMNQSRPMFNENSRNSHDNILWNSSYQE